MEARKRDAPGRAASRDVSSACYGVITRAAGARRPNRIAWARGQVRLTGPPMRGVAMQRVVVSVIGAALLFLGLQPAPAGAVGPRPAGAPMCGETWGVNVSPSPAGGSEL